jgi:outer membrane lipoprotein carrier protein
MLTIHRPFGRWCLLAALFVTAGVANAGGKDRLAAFLDGVESLQARFDQSVFDTSQGQSRRLEGIFYLQRPGKFRWDYTEPKGQLVLADGRTVWLVEEDLKQAYQKPQSEALRGTPALMLAERLKLEDHFEIADLGASQDLEWVELVPRDAESQFARVLLAFKGNELRRMELADKFAQVTRIGFSDIQRNPRLDPKLFVYVPPRGTQLFEH